MSREEGLEEGVKLCVSESHQLFLWAKYTQSIGYGSATNKGVCVLGCVCSYEQYETVPRSNGFTSEHHYYYLGGLAPLREVRFGLKMSRFYVNVVRKNMSNKRLNGSQGIWFPLWFSSPIPTRRVK